MSNLQLTLSSKFGLINTCPCLLITISFGVMYPVAFQIPKTTSTTLSFQVLPGHSVNVQLNVASPPLLPIKGRLGLETIFRCCCWFDANELKKEWNGRMSWIHIVHQIVHYSVISAQQLVPGKICLPHIFCKLDSLLIKYLASRKLNCTFT